MVIFTFTFFLGNPVYALMKIIEEFKVLKLTYSETLNNEYIERIHQMSYSSISDFGMLQIFSYLIK